jgi:hypothetical protein
MQGDSGFVLVDLIACAPGNAVTPASASSELKEWRTAIGTPPSKNDFETVLAACEDRANSGNNIGPLEGCLADYGLHRVQSLDQISRPCLSLGSGLASRSARCFGADFTPAALTNHVDAVLNSDSVGHRCWGIFLWRAAFLGLSCRWLAVAA